MTYFDESLDDQTDALTNEKIDWQKREERKKNTPPFVQLVTKNIPAVRALAKNNPTALQIFLFLTEHMSTENAVACSHKVLQEVTEKSRQTVWKAVKYLDENGFLIVMKSGSSNVYTLNHYVVWKALNEKRKFCKFNGKILLSKEENPGLLQKLEKFKTNSISLKN